MDAHPGHRLHRGHKALVNGKRAHAGGNVAAVSAVVDQLRVEADLGEGIVYIRPLAARRADDGKLAGEYIRAAQAIDLPTVGGSEYTPDHPCPGLRILGKFVLLDENALAGAAALNDHAVGRHI